MGDPYDLGSEVKLDRNGWMRRPVVFQCDGCGALYFGFGRVDVDVFGRAGLRFAPRCPLCAQEDAASRREERKRERVRRREERRAARVVDAALQEYERERVRLYQAAHPDDDLSPYAPPEDPPEGWPAETP